MRTLFCWLIILASATTVFLKVGSEEKVEAQKTDGPDVQELAMGRMAVGARALLSGLDETSSEVLDDLPQELVEQARTPAERFRAAIVVAELSKPDDAWPILFRAQTDATSGNDQPLRRDIARFMQILRAQDDSPDEVEPSTQPVEAVHTDEEFVERHGWFARLALAHGLPPDHPTRQAAIRPAIRAVIGVYSMMIIVIGAVIVGFVLFIIALVLLATGTMRLAPRPHIENDGPILEAFALYIGCFALAAVWEWRQLPLGFLAQPVLQLGGTVLAIFWPMIRGMSWRDMKRAVGLTRVRYPDGVIPPVYAQPTGFQPMPPPLTPAQSEAPLRLPPTQYPFAEHDPRAPMAWHRPAARPSFFREAFAGVIGYVALLPLMVLGFIATASLQKYAAGDGAQHPIVDLLTGPLWIIVLVFVLATVFAPITEELFFRGALFGHMRRRIHWLPAAVIVGVIFAAIHPQGWTAIPVLGVIGFNFCVLRQWRGGLVAPMVAHALNNGFVLTMALLLLR